MYKSQLISEIENQFLLHNHECHVFYNLISVAHSNVIDIRLKFLEEEVYGEKGEPIISSMLLNVAIILFPVHSIIGNSAINIIKRSNLIRSIARRSLIKLAPKGTEIIRFVDENEKKLFKQSIGDPLSSVVEDSIKYFANFNKKNSQVRYVTSIRESSFLWWESRQRSVMNSYIKAKLDINKGSYKAGIIKHTNDIKNNPAINYSNQNLTELIRIFEIIILFKTGNLESSLVQEKKSYARWWDTEAGGTYNSIAKNKKRFASFLIQRYRPILVSILINQIKAGSSQNSKIPLWRIMSGIDRSKFRSDTSYFIKVLIDIGKTFRSMEAQFSSKF